MEPTETERAAARIDAILSRQGIRDETSEERAVRLAKEAAAEPFVQAMHEAMKARGHFTGLTIRPSNPDAVFVVEKDFGPFSA
jgi:hypothetical protein